MKNQFLLIRLFAVVTAMMCALGIQAQEAYACYTPENTTLTFYYDNQRSSRPGDIYDLNSGENYPDWYIFGTFMSCTKVVFNPSFAAARPTTTQAWFYQMNKLTSITGMNYLNTENVTNMHFMFYNCRSLTSLDLSGFNTTNVSDMSFMFTGCSVLTSLDVSGFNTANVTDMGFMFSGCSGLRSLDLSGFNTENVTQMYYMFSNCSSLTSLDLSSFNTPKVEEVVNMFSNCSNLRGIDISHFDISSITSLNLMFAGCSSLRSLDLSSFNTENVKETSQMFRDCSSLVKIYVSDLWNMDSVNHSWLMFDNCLSLVGGQGTTYDSNYTGLVRARIDGGPSKPGYLSYKEAPAWTSCFEKDGIYYHILGGTNTVSVVTKDENLNSYSGEVTIPASVTYKGRTYGVIAIADMAFFGCTRLTKVTIPNTVNSIGRTAFDGCTSLQTIECLAVTPPSLFNDSFTSYGAVLWVPYGSKAAYQAADYWSRFTTILQLPSTYFDFKENGIYYKYTGYNTVEVVNDGTDGYFCYSGNVEIPETAYDADDGWYYRVASIGERAFYRCPSLVTVTIPATVDLIHNEAFVDCFDAYPDQSSITCLAQTPPTASPTAFGSGEQSYVTLYVPYGKKSAYQAAAVWRNFSNIVELNYSFKKDGFYYKITGSNTVSVTYKDANYNTYSGRVLIPRRVTFEDVTYTVTAIDNLAFFGCTDLTSVSIPEMVTTIGNRTFKNCTSLTSITIPNSVTSVGVYAFENCEGLTEVTLGSGLQSIGAYAFYGCTELMRGDIISLATVPPTIQNSTFIDQYQGASLYVPYGCRNAYANANYWQNFYDIYEIITLDDALNVDGGDMLFTSGGDYPWTSAESDGRAYAVSGNGGVASSTSTLTAEVYVEGNAILSFDFKAWGEGTDRIYDMCVFLIDGEEQFCYGALDNDWETYSVELTLGVHTLEWRYSKDESVDPDGDYFAVDNVRIATYEAYACYTESNTTLTFYYDTQRSSRTGTTYDLNTGSNDADWDTDGTNVNVTNVVFDPSFANARPTTTYDWFFNMVNLESITGMSYLNTSEVTNMRYMFAGCTQLTSLDLSSFNTSKVTSMGAMFNNCSSLTSLDLSSFNTSQVTGMIYMFHGCSNLTSLDLSGFNTSKVTDMSFMFYENSNLRTIYVTEDWNTEAATYSTDMFYSCTSLVGGKGTTWNSSNPTNKTYAHIDGGTSNPGYFTDKNAIMRGDVNGDGQVNIADVTTLISLVLRNISSNPAADVNNDSNVNIADVTVLISRVLSGHW